MVKVFKKADGVPANRPTSLVRTITSTVFVEEIELAQAALAREGVPSLSQMIRDCVSEWARKERRFQEASGRKSRQ